MGKKVMGGFGLDVRPDRIDFRDYPYRPPLKSLLREYPELELIQTFADYYDKDEMVLQQGAYGACTGFGLSAVINYLNWEREVAPVIRKAHAKLERKSKTFRDRRPAKGWKMPDKVSESMLYLNARLYDEWDGDDYEGSSCRGAMKGWHKHGVCPRKQWGYLGDSGPGLPEDEEWKDSSGETVLGAYYRINAKSIVEMQAAICEIHAIYCAAEVHDGWLKLGLRKVASLQDAMIGEASKDSVTGGHAFAIVGYTCDGFIVQNSWGKEWGYKGFAILPYGDWVENGYDAWALALGAPVRGTKSPAGQSRLSLQERSRGPAGWSIFGGGKSEPHLPKGVTAWSDDDVSNHVVISTIDGAPVRHLPDTLNAKDCVRTAVRRAVGKKPPQHIAIYIHGGLNGKDDGLLRAGYMGPWFQANGIAPIFPVWQTDAKSSILHSLAELIGLDDLVKDIEAKGPGSKPKSEPIDRRVEELARRSPGKGAWAEMKNKARGLSEDGGALFLTFEALAEFAKDSQVHLIGHSAGGIVACHAHDAMKHAGLNLGTVSLYAPAGTARLAVDCIKPHLESGYLKKGSVFIDVLSNRREEADACIKKFGVKVYSKSLLYLVSRAFEDKHKTPILGMDTTLHLDPKTILEEDIFPENLMAPALEWRKLVSDYDVKQFVWDQDTIPVSRIVSAGKTTSADNTHGSFDNNIDCVEATLQRICGSLKFKIEDLNFGGG